MIINTKIKLDDEKLINSVIKALEPDNIDFPENIFMSISHEKNMIIIKIECSYEKILSCRSTLDEILMIIQSILKTFKNIR